MTKAVYNSSLLLETRRMSLLIFLCLVKSVDVLLGAEICVRLVITTYIFLSGNYCSHIGLLNSMITWNARFKLLTVPSLEI